MKITVEEVDMKVVRSVLMPIENKQKLKTKRKMEEDVLAAI